MLYDLRAEVSTFSQLKQALSDINIKYIYAPVKILIENCFTDQEIERIIVSLPVFLGGENPLYKGYLLKLKNLGYSSALVNTLDTIGLCDETGFEKHGSFRLNITNSQSALVYKDLGLKDAVLSLELSLRRSVKIKRNVLDFALGILIYGRIPLMTVRRCPINDGKICGKNGCDKKITDRKGLELPLICDNTVNILNPHTLILSDRIDDFSDFNFHVLSFTTEENVSEVVNLYLNRIKPTKNFTRGLY